MKSMSTDKRRFRSGTLTHCYQNTKNGFLLFYSKTDYLVYFTIVCMKALQHKIRVLSICQMPDHTHGGYIAERLAALSSFMRDVTSLFARIGQSAQCRRGELFNTHYGSAPKTDAKKVRTTLVYIGNNPVERQLVSKAEDYQWNYLAYAKSSHPFSEELVIRRASFAMRKAISEVKGNRARNRPLSYSTIQRLFATLDKKESLQLVDLIVSTYSVIDFEAASGFFDGYDDMIGAMHYNTGSEYDIKEVKVGRSDLCYGRICTWLMKNLHLSDIHDVFLLSESERTDLLFDINKELGIPIEQVAKYLRLIVESRKI